MKTIKTAWAAVALLALTLVSCNDFFDTDPGNIINEEDYIAKDDEMYKGFLGIISRVQEAGDHSIFLTDTRCNFLDVTENAPVALQDIYNYNATNGNEYADPTCYYAIIIACNDYFSKMEQYHKNVGGMSENSETSFSALLSSAVRLKVWAYYMLGRIYGQAYWFDDPLTEMKDLGNTEVFTPCDMRMLADKCLALLETGITVDGIAVASDLTMNWYTWLDEENQDQVQFMQWQYITPPRIILEAELRSWRASYLDEAAAQADWLWVRDNLLKWMYDIHSTAPEAVANMSIPGFTTADVSYDDDGTASWITSPTYVYQTNIPLQSDATYPYYSIFCCEENIGNRMQVISGIIYNYTYGQYNRLVQYFCPTYPDANAFYLKPSEYGLNLYNEDDIRSLTQQMVLNTLGGQPAVTKYYYSYNATSRTYEYLNDNIFQIEPTILMFRGHDLHFLIAEAENHLGNWRQARAILNMGLNNEFADKVLPEGWSSYYSTWFGGNGGYGDVGIVGCARGTTHSLPSPEDEGYNITEEQRKEIYDWALADEYLKEYVAEGKAYSYLCKMGERYSRNGYQPEAARDSVAKRIAPKYSAGMQQKVTNYIQSNGYWVQWDLD